MSPITHLLASWAAAQMAPLEHRDRKLVVWCGVLPDLDGLGLIIDLANELVGRPETFFYSRYHHSLTHGLPAALFLPLLLAALGRQRWRVWLWGVGLIHLHFACDLLGSRGPSPTDLWPIYYLAPLTHQPMLVWPGQWPLNGGQNLLITVGLLVFAIGRAIITGHSPFSLLSETGDQAVVTVLRKRLRRTVRQKTRPRA